MRQFGGGGMGGFGGGPMFVMPGFGGYDPRQHQQQDVPEIAVPARVRQAMQYIELCSQKTQQRAAVSESQIQLIDGVPLTEDESTALTTACNLLTKYFAGQTGFDKWEELRFKSLQQKVEQRIPKKVKTARLSAGPCPVCGGTKKECSVCAGSGKVIIVPAEDEQQLMELMMQAAEAEVEAEDEDEPPTS